VPVKVVGCSTDRLTTPEHCRRLAAMLGASYHDLDVPGGHIWMIVEPTLLSAALRKEGAFSDHFDRTRDSGRARDHKGSIR
jgi:homoserine acetyltransferase